MLLLPWAAQALEAMTDPVMVAELVLRSTLSPARKTPEPASLLALPVRLASASSCRPGRLGVRLNSFQLTLPPSLPQVAELETPVLASARTLIGQTVLLLPLSPSCASPW